MATLQELEAALVNADKAGDAASAKVLAQAVEQARAQSYVQPEGFGSKMNTAVTQALRAPGLTARAGMKGLGELVGAVAEPLRLPMSAALRATGLRDTPIPNASQIAESVSDAVGLPQPQTPNERIASDAVSLMAGAGATMGAAGAIPAASQTAREVIRQFVSNPGTQIAGAAGAGTAGSYVRETGGNPLSQFLASVAGGVGAGSAVNLADRGINSIRSAWQNFRNPQQASQQIDAVIEQQLGNSVNWQALPTDVKNQLRQDVGAAMQGGTLSPDAVKRLADYRLAGATPTRAGLTLDPVDVTRQRNLAKLGANSNDPTVQTLARTENENARTLGTNVQEMAGNVTNDRFVNSERALSALKAVDDARASKVRELYGVARDSLGRAAPLDPATATQKAGLALAEAQAGGSLPAAAQKILNDVAAGKVPFNVDTKEQMVRILGQMAQGATRGDERTAINIVRKALDDAPLLETHGLGPDALAAFKAARSAHAERMRAQEASPALKAAAEGMEPDRFFQQFVLGNEKGSVRSLSNLKKEIGEDSEGFKALRGQLVAYLKKAGNVNEDIGTFNQSSFNNALESIGDKKLAVFFKPEELEKLKAIARVARYEQAQGRGTAVNNSSTGGAVFNLLERLADSSLVTRIPLVGQVPGNAVLRIRSSQAQNVPAAISMPAPEMATQAPILSPALAGLLAGQQDDKKNRRAKALLE